MDDNALVRARRALQLIEPRGGQPAAPAPDASRGRELIAAARQAATGGRPQPRPAAPPPQPVMPPVVTVLGPQIVRVPMTCGATGRVFIDRAERHDNVLHLLGQFEFPQPGSGGAADVGLLSGAYRVECIAGWACPVCGTNTNADTSGSWAWQCNCAKFNGALHCAGSRGRGRYCACGKFEDRHLVPTEMIQVRGAAVAAAPVNPQSARPSSSAGMIRPGAAPRAVPDVAASSTPRLTWRR